MRTSWQLSILASFLLAPVTVGQVDVIWTNISSTAGTYKDSITIADLAGTQRPLAQHPNNGSGGTGAVRSQAFHLNLGGVDYLYWVDTNNQGAVFRGTDSNGNGVIDTTEFEKLWTDSVGTNFLACDTIRHHNGKFVLSNDSFSGANNRGVWLLEDMNADGDFFDAGESVEIINGGGSFLATIVVSGVTTSSDDIEAADLLSNDDVVWCCDDDKIWFRWDSVTKTNSVFLNYDTSRTAAGMLPANPDFGVSLPIPGSVSGTSEDLDLVTVDQVTDSVYLAVNFENDEPWIYKCLDGNADGDANDAGEVTLFWDGSLAAAGLTKAAIDDLFWMAGSLYFSLEEDPGVASLGHMLQLTDFNNDGDAMDPGEQTTLLTLPAGDDPTVFGFSVVPAGTFGSGCVRVSLDDSGLSSTAPAPWTFTFEDIPVASQGGTDLGFVGISLTGSGPLNLGGSCVVGLDVDFFTTIFLTFLPNFTTPSITGSTATTVGFPAVQFPKGLTFYYAGLIAGPGGLIVSQSRSVTVQ